MRKPERVDSEVEEGDQWTVMSENPLLGALLSLSPSLEMTTDISLIISI